MAIEEQRTRIRRSLEEKLGVEEAAYLIDRPPGGWGELVTNQTLGLRFDAVDQRFEAIDRRFEAIDRRFEAIDQRFEAIDHRFDTIDQRFEALGHRLRADFREETTRLLLWIVPTIFAGIAALGAIVAAAS